MEDVLNKKSTKINQNGLWMFIVTSYYNEHSAVNSLQARRHCL
jgi:hypothetical protein